MEVVLQLAFKCLPGFKRGTIKKLSYDIHLVIAGVKPSLLIDTIAVDRNLHKLDKFIEQLNSRINTSKAETSLEILKIKEDYFVVNVKELLKRLEKERFYVDVSACLQLPIIITNPSVRILP